MAKSRQAPAPPPAPPAAAAARSIWIDRPWIDLLIGCGGWSIPLLLVSYTLVERDVPTWSAVFYGLALVCNYPHYMATIYRAYGRDDRGAYRLYTHWLTAALVALGVAAHAWFALVPWLFTAYILWSPWHYTGQNFGVLMMFLRRAGVDVSGEERQRLYLAFIGSYVMLLAAFNAGPSSDPLVLSLGLPPMSARLMEATAGLTFLAGGLSAFAPLWRRAPRGALIAPLTMYTTQALWFVIPVAIDWLTPLSAPQTRYSSGMLAVMHSAQYLWITRYFARRDAEQTAGAAGWHPWAYAATLVAGGMALFLPVPWLASYGWHLDFTTSVLIVAAIVNIHHFMIDGVVWKLRNPRVGRVLVDGAPAPAEATAPVPARTRLGWTWRIAAVAGVIALVALAAVDQIRYVLASGHGDAGKLASAASLNPYDSTTYVRLAQAETAAGRADAATAALRRAVAANPENPAPARALIRRLIESDRLLDAHGEALAFLERFPDDVDMLVNAGVLAYRLDDPAAAEQWWRRAAARDPSQPRIQLYLAEQLDARGASRDAVSYYRRYLELVVQGKGGDKPPPAAIVAVIVKYGDALAKIGQRDLARTQYELAMKLAAQTGLTELGTLAETQRRALDTPAPGSP